jgi:hypothetical protein
LSIDLNTNTKSAAIPSSSVAPQASVPLAEQSQPVPEGLMDALLRSSSSRNRPSGKPLSSFENGLEDVVIATSTGQSLNKFDLLCPRQGCGSVILKREVARWLQRTSETVGTTMHQGSVDKVIPLSSCNHPKCHQILYLRKFHLDKRIIGG